MGKKKQKNQSPSTNNIQPTPPETSSVSVPANTVPDKISPLSPTPAVPSQKISRKAWLLQQAKELTLVAVVVLAIIGHVAQGSMVIGKSMYPTFNKEVTALEKRNWGALKYVGTNMVIVNKLSWYFQSWNYGDIVILYSPREPKKKLIKRLLAREGDLLKIRNQFYTMDIGEVFVAGDNLDDSFDSRSFGAIPEGLLQGKVWLQIWPLFPKFISSELPEVNKNEIHLEKAIRNKTEAEILAEICQAVVKQWNLAPEKVSGASRLSEFNISISDVLPLLEKTFFEKAVIDKYKYNEQVKKEFIDLDQHQFPQENFKTLAQIARQLYRDYSKEFESEDFRKYPVHH